VTLLAIDPGTAKCGMAVVDAVRGKLHLEVVRREELLSVVRQWAERFPLEAVIVGGATGSRPVVQELSQGLELKVVVVDEFRTTERARLRYFQDHPPRGLWKLVPLGLQSPAVAIDDYAALVMAEDYLEKIRKESA
jgi:RNase H-fold protein (predicted Holliday junction resolvase)